MFQIKFLIYLVLTVLSVMQDEVQSFESLVPPPTLSSQKKKLIIDTDAGSDDGVAILNILGAEELFGDIQVKLITAVAGNTHVYNVVKNVLKILKTANRLDIPVHRGVNESLIWTPEIKNYFGKDGFGDFPFDDPPSDDFLQNGHAVNALIEYTMLSPGELTLVCLGPLTNIALAIKLESNFFKNLKEIYILGGSDSGVGNVKPGVEYNFHVDPESTLIVLKEAEKHKKPVNLVTWETAILRSLIDMKWRKEILGVIKNPRIDLINNAERLTLIGDNWISSDTILSSIVIDETLIESEGDYNADVEICGRISRAALFLDYSNLKNQTNNVHVIKKINVNKYKKMLLQNFNPQAGLNNGGARTRR